jgi:hypothetical protein
VNSQSRPVASAEALTATRVNVRDLLTSSPAFRALPVAQQQEIAKHTVQVAAYLAEPDGIRLPPERYAGLPPGARDSYAFGQEAPLATEQATPVPVRSGQGGGPGQFQAVAAREGAQVAGMLLQQVSFPTFVASLVQGVFHAIVESSIEQMEAYGRLVADVAKSLNQFRDENTTENQGRDHLVDQFPDLFEISMESDAETGPSARVRLREGADEDAAVKKVNGSGMPIAGGELKSIDDDTIEEKLVPAARTQLATSRQQLLATMVLMGINRIVVTDGRIQAKVMYDFQARDNFRRNYSATKMDYEKGVMQRQGHGTYEGSSEGASESTSGRAGSEDYTHDKRDASYYSKGEYKWAEQPVLKLMSIDTSQQDSALQTKASLAGTVDINFKSDYLALDKMADSFQIAQIQNAASPASRQAQPAGGGSGAAQTGTPAGGTAPAAGAPAAAGGTTARP